MQSVDDQNVIMWHMIVAITQIKFIKQITL